MAAVSRLERAVDALHQFYGTLPAPPRDPFTLFVWEVLSVHSTPQKRDAALAALKRHRALTPDAMWKAPQKRLEESVKLAGPYVENRLRALRTGVEVFRRQPKLPSIIRGPLPPARKALDGLPQMGEGLALGQVIEGLVGQRDAARGKAGQHGSDGRLGQPAHRGDGVLGSGDIAAQRLQPGRQGTAWGTHQLIQAPVDQAASALAGAGVAGVAAGRAISPGRGRCAVGA